MAIIIGMAVAGLPKENRGRIIFWGVAGATVLRILFAALTWYILPSVDRLWNEMRTSRQSQFFVQILDFYPPDVQRYGREYFTTLDECVARCPLRLRESESPERSRISTSDPSASRTMAFDPRAVKISSRSLSRAPATIGMLPVSETR